jgi:hypothetical protein
MVSKLVNNPAFAFFLQPQSVISPHSPRFLTLDDSPLDLKTLGKQVGEEGGREGGEADTFIATPQATECWVEIRDERIEAETQHPHPA